MIAIIAALPREIAGFIHGSSADAQLLKRGIHLHRVPGAIVCAAGMGADRAALAVEAALATQTNEERVEWLMSVGLAGSCSAGLAAGAVVEATEVIDARTGEHYSAGVGVQHWVKHPEIAEAKHVLVTTAGIASVHEKARLASAYGACMVDMEAATVARLAVAHGLPFRAIKGVSDAHDFELASMSRFTGKHGHFRTGAFALHTAIRPHHWAKAAKLGRNSNAALTRLHERLRRLLS